MSEVNQFGREGNVGGQRTAETRADDVAVMSARGGLNRLLLLAALVVSAVSCDEKEQPPVQDFVAGPTEPVAMPKSPSPTEETDEWIRQSQKELDQLEAAVGTLEAALNKREAMMDTPEEVSRVAAALAALAAEASATGAPTEWEHEELKRRLQGIVGPNINGGNRVPDVPLRPADGFAHDPFSGIGAY